MAGNRPYTYGELASLQADLSAQGKGELPVLRRAHTAVYFELDDDTFRVFLYGSQIAVLHSDGKVEVHRRGHWRNTTKNRLNDVLIPLGWKVHNKEAHWYLQTTHRPTRFMDFRDGMIITNININPEEN